MMHRHSRYIYKPSQQQTDEHMTWSCALLRLGTSYRMHTAGLTSQTSRRHPGQPAAAGREPEKSDRYFRISAASTTAEHVRLVLLYQVGPVGLHRLRCRCWGSGWGKCRDRWCRLGNQGLTRDQRGSAFFSPFRRQPPISVLALLGTMGAFVHAVYTQGPAQIRSRPRHACYSSASGCPIRGHRGEE